MSIGRNILLSVIEKTCSSTWAFSVVLSLLDSTVFVGDADDMLTQCCATSRLCWYQLTDLSFEVYGNFVQYIIQRVVISQKYISISTISVRKRAHIKRVIWDSSR